MKKYFIVLFLLFAFCGDNSEQTPQPEAISTDTTEATITAEEESTTTTEIVQLDSFDGTCLLYTSPSPRDRQKSRMPSSA